jgi:uncharacterized RDD family membrane protein YckC
METEALPPASEPLSSASAGAEDLLDLRIGAALIDLALLFGLLVVLTVLIGEASVGDGFSFSLNSYAAAALYFALVLVYYFALEATIGQTVGKLLTGVRVVSAGGCRPSAGAVAIRTLLRVVDWLPLLCLVGFLTMLATGNREQRLGDLAARTGIARAVPIRHRGLTAAAVACALVLVLAGSVVYVATSDEDAGAKTYSGHGVSFDYPAGWEETTAKTVAGGLTELWDTAVAAGDLDLVVVTGYRLNRPVTAEDLDAFTSEIGEVIQLQASGTAIDTCQPDVIADPGPRPPQP